MGIMAIGPAARRGRIRIQLVAVLLLGIAISMFLSAARSLSREFDGLIVDKLSEEGLRSAYWLDLSAQVGSLSQDPSSIALQAMQGSLARRRVGVSGMVHDQSRLLQRARKAAWSCFIYVDEERHIDLGLKWLAWGIIGLCAAVIIHRKTRDPGSIPTSSLDEEEDEEATDSE
ncbi:MAG TPA: hypothetical protein PLP29_12775 [Candidatus Ozemobacteraceae bacterium]|nr:hypothetical protein [Candidatus Ozemobacteraceae bacterium]